MRAPTPFPLTPLRKRSRYTFLSHGVYQQCVISWYDGGVKVRRVNRVWHQDVGVAPAEGVGLSTGENVMVDGCRRDEVWRVLQVCHSVLKRPARRKGNKVTRWTHGFSSKQRKCFNISLVVFLVYSHFAPGKLGAPCLLLGAQGLFFSATYIINPEL